MVIRTLDPSLDKEVACICNAWLQCAEDLAESGAEIFKRKLNSEQPWKVSTSMQLVAKAKPQEEKAWNQIIPPQDHRWRKVFSETEARCLPKHQPWDISINLIGGDNHTLDCKVHPLTSTEKPKLDEHILNMLEKGFIHPSKSKICSPLFFTGKKDGKGCPVINYRRLNSITEPDWFPILLLQEIIDKVQRAKLLSKGGCMGRILQHPHGGRKRMEGSFQNQHRVVWTYIHAIQAKSASAIFQRMMNMQFADIVNQGNIIIYFYSILITTEDDPAVHRRVVSQVLDWLQELNLYLKPSKCTFKTKRIEFLGVILENGTVIMDQIKVSCVKEWKVPTNVMENHSFQGFTNFYHCFIPNFLKIARPLNDLLRTGVKWYWGEEQRAFEEIKNLITSEPVLRQLDQTKPFEGKVKAWDYTMGAVLL